MDGEFDFEKGTTLANAGMARAVAATRVQTWREKADAWFIGIETGRTFTADDITKAVGLPDSGANKNNAVGGWINAKAKKFLIRFSGVFSKSARKDRHTGLQRVWTKQ